MVLRSNSIFTLITSLPSKISASSNLLNTSKSFLYVGLKIIDDVQLFFNIEIPLLSQIMYDSLTPEDFFTLFFILSLFIILIFSTT